MTGPIVQVRIELNIQARRLSFEPRFTRQIFWHHPLNRLLERSRVIMVLQVAQLMYHHIVHDAVRCLNHFPVKQYFIIDGAANRKVYGALTPHNAFRGAVDRGTPYSLGFAGHHSCLIF